FAAVVKPFLANKLEKTFLDHWLLGDDLSGYLETWSFAQLNLIEKILLAQRLAPPQQEAVARVMRESAELRPIPVERLEQLFRFALESNDLAKDKSRLIEAFGAESRPMQRPAEAPAPRDEVVRERQAAAAKAEKRADGDEDRRKLDEADLAPAVKLSEEMKQR